MVDMIEKVESFVKMSAVEVFSTMLSLDLEEVETSAVADQEQLAGSVGFTGDLNGVVYLMSNAAFVQSLTRRMLGFEQEDECDDSLVFDTLGELTNMVVGNTKSRMSSYSVNCVLTVPSVVKGHRFEIESLRFQDHRRLEFKCDGGGLRIEILLKKTAE